MSAPLVLASQVQALGLAQGLLPHSAMLDRQPLVHRVQTSSKEGRNLVIAGVKAFERAQYDSAVKSFSSALTVGGLTSEGIAKAMFFRAQSYQQSKKYAQAIADYNSALWLKNGLSQDERTRATSLRAQAYKSAGLRAPPSSASADVAANTTGSPAASTTVTKVPPAASNPLTGLTNSLSNIGNPLSGIGTAVTGLFGGGNTTTQQDQPAAPKPPPTVTAATQPAPAAVSGWNSATQTQAAPVASNTSVAAAAPRPPAAPAPVQQQAPTKPAPTPAWTTASQRAAPVIQRPVQTAPRQAATPPPAAAPARPKPPVQTAALPTEPKAAQPAPRSVTASSNSKPTVVQVAAVRSRGEAERTVARLVAKYGSQLGSRRPSITETVFGNMGTFYRVEVGPFASKSATETLCASLKSSGYDCLITSQ